MITLNDVVLYFGKYPNKETSFKLDQNLIMDYNIFDFKYEDDSSLIQLMFAKKEVDSISPKADNNLIIHYMPYSRLDRREEEVCFTLKYISEFINYLGFTEIVVAEPHSDVTCGALDRSTPVPMTPAIFTKALEDSIIDFDDKVDYICFPDACEKLSIICPFVEINGKQDCQGCVFKIHTIAELQEIVLGHYLGS